MLTSFRPTIWLTLALFAELGESFVQYGLWGLVIVSFMESSFFPVPPDFIQIGLTLPHLDKTSPLFAPQMAFTYAFASTCASVAGSLLGWLIGKYAGERFFVWLIRKRWLSREKFDTARDLLQRYDMGAIMIAAFTPIPYKLFTIASGVSGMPIWRLLLASVIGRGGRFFLVAGLLYWQGPAAVDFIMGSKFAVLTIVIALVVVLVAWVVYRMRRHPARPGHSADALAASANSGDLSHDQP